MAFSIVKEPDNIACIKEYNHVDFEIQIPFYNNGHNILYLTLQKQSLVIVFITISLIT